MPNLILMVGDSAGSRIDADASFLEKKWFFSKEYGGSAENR